MLSTIDSIDIGIYKNFSFPKNKDNAFHIVSFPGIYKSFPVFFRKQS